MKLSTEERFIQWLKIVGGIAALGILVEIVNKLEEIISLLK